MNPETAAITCPDCEGEFAVRDMPDVERIIAARVVDALNEAARLIGEAMFDVVRTSPGRPGTRAAGLEQAGYIVRAVRDGSTRPE